MWIVVWAFSLLSLELFAEPRKLSDMSFELSCVREKNAGQKTQMIHVKLEYSGESNSCTASHGRHVAYQDDYEIPFVCEKPTAVLVDEKHAIQSWIFTGGDVAKHQINRLVLMMDHDNMIANGFALSNEGESFPVYCKKW